MTGTVRILSANFTDTTLPKITSLANLEAAVRAISGMRGWWDISNSAYYTATSGKLSQVLDRSGNGYNLTQATAANQPTLTAAAFGTFNSVARDGATFDGSTDLYMTTPAGVFDGSTAFTIAQFVRYNGTATVAPFSSNDTINASTYMQGQTNNTVVVGAFTGLVTVNTGAAITANIAQIATVTPGTTSGNSNLYIEGNGVSNTASNVAAKIPASGASAVLGALGTSHSNYKMNGSVAEVLMFDGDLTQVSGALSAIRAMFAFKYRNA